MRANKNPVTILTRPLLLAPIIFFLFSLSDRGFDIDSLEAPVVFEYSHQHAICFSLALYLVSLVFFFFLGDFVGFYGIFLGLCFASLLFWVALALSLSFFFFEGGEVHLYLGSALRLLPGYSLSVSLALDLISFSFLFLTITIAVCVNIFAFSYFRYEPNVERLLLLLNAFILSMGILVIAGNLVVLFLGWEMIGLTSFLLINFWHTRVGTLKAAFKAYSFNKFSDSSLLLGLVYFYFAIGDLDLRTLGLSLPTLVPALDSSLGLVCPLEVVSALFLSAALVKSAQLGFHIWLPDSMEAPVPASALIHSATLVSAGVFLLVRLQCLFELSGLASIIVPAIGSLTAFVGGFSALVQTDLKRILAYSTISHCGFLFFLASSGTLEHTLFYLYVHGFFKASSFLCVGSVLRFTHGYQDFRRMGGLWKHLPAELYFLLFCLSCLSGMPMFFGYSVKHLALGSNSGSVVSLLSGSLSMLAAFAGLFYSHRIIYFVFFDSKKGRKSVYLSCSGEQLRSIYYSNTTLASSVSILILASSAYLVSYLAACSLSVDSGLAQLGGVSAYGLNLAPSSSLADAGLHFNFKFLNLSVCIYFFFLNFFCWSRSTTLSYASLCTIALVLFLA